MENPIGKERCSRSLVTPLLMGQGCQDGVQNVIELLARVFRKESKDKISVLLEDDLPRSR